MQWPKEEDIPSQKAADYFHGFFMTLGLIFFQGEGLLSFRLYKNEQRFISKLIHLTLHSIAVGFLVTALVCIITAKSLKNEHHFTSFHGWFGLLTMLIYVVQFAFGFGHFCFPGVRLHVQSKLIPVHRFLGIVSFFACSIQVIVGHVQLYSWNGGNCSSLFGCDQAVDLIYRILMISLIIYAILVIFCVMTPKWRRTKSLNEEE